MANPINKLSAVLVASPNLAPRRYSDGGGLYLNVTASGAKSWVFMWVSRGKRYEMGLGSAQKAGKGGMVSLARAREKAQEIRDILGQGGDPFTEMQERKAAIKNETFGSVADQFVKAMEPSWENPKHVAQWKMTLGDAYCKSLRPLHVSEISTDDVLKVLRPVWTKKPETAARLRGRIERVLDYAKINGWRTGDNPARWDGHLKAALPERKKLSRGHHTAMPYEDVPAFLVRVQAADATAARALEVLILTAARSGEIIHAKWNEFDLDKAIWTVPAERMKARKEHRVPLPPRAVTVLKAMLAKRVSDYVFPGQKPKKPLSNMAMDMLLRRMKTDVTVHGFRSSFRDWAGDRTNFPRDVAEAALAHSVGNDVELAYRRGDAFVKRRKMMQAWEGYLLSPKSGTANNVTKFGPVGASAKIG